MPDQPRDAMDGGSSAGDASKMLSDNLVDETHHGGVIAPSRAAAHVRPGVVGYLTQVLCPKIAALSSRTGLTATTFSGSTVL